MPKLIVAVLISLLVMGSVLAQDTTSNFDEFQFQHVAVIRAYPAVDNNGRRVVFYSENEQITVDFPAGLTRAIVIAEIPLLTLPNPESSFILLEFVAEPQGYRTWIADSTSRTIKPVETPCPINDLSYEEQWVYLSLGDQTFLCNKITGVMSPPLPDNLEWGYTGYGSVDVPDMSPDGRFVLLRGAFDLGNRYGWRVYSYEVGSQTFRTLGELGGFGEPQVRFLAWLTPTQFVMLADDMPEWSSRNFHLGDASKQDSLHFALSKLRFLPRIVPDPLSFEDMQAVFHDGPTPGPCFLEVYDVATRRAATYDTGSLCEYGVIIPDGSGDRLYRAVYPEAALVRFNHVTGTRRNLFAGEIEAIGAVSPDGQLVQIALGNNGIVDSDQDPDANFGYAIEPTEYTLMDLNNGTFLGRVPASATWLSPTQLFDETESLQCGRRWCECRANAWGNSAGTAPFQIAAAEDELQ